MELRSTDVRALYYPFLLCRPVLMLAGQAELWYQTLWNLSSLSTSHFSQPRNELEVAAKNLTLEICIKNFSLLSIPRPTPSPFILSLRFCRFDTQVLPFHILPTLSNSLLNYQPLLLMEQGRGGLCSRISQQIPWVKGSQGNWLIFLKIVFYHVNLQLYFLPRDLY